MEAAESIVVGTLYPAEWYGSRRGLADEVAELEAVDPRVEVVTATYEEPHDVRTARGAGATDGALPEAQPIEPEDRATLSRIRVALAIDLPPDIT